MTSILAAPPLLQPEQGIAHLGPAGTYAEAAALKFKQIQAWDPDTSLIPCPTIANVLEAVAEGSVEWGVVPVENSVEGGVSMTLDTLWQLEKLQIHQALILPIRHTLISSAHQLKDIEVVYSHPQALAQCRQWLKTHLPQVQQVTSRSTTDELWRIPDYPNKAVIASERAAELYQLPIKACPINDHPENSTRFWLVGSQLSEVGDHTSLAFSLPENVPGALLKPLQILADRNLNMSRIESRPTKISAGTYVFFIDIEHPHQPSLPSSLIQDFQANTEILKLLGTYPLLLTH